MAQQTEQNNKQAKNYKHIYEAAYEAMNNSVLDIDCGTLCSHNCCRNDYENPEEFGVYLLPFEYEHFLKNTGMMKPSQMDWHAAKDRFMPKSLKGLNYFYCNVEKDCLRQYRPVQCRTYPLEPHLENGKLSLIVEKDQIHECPLIQRREQWRADYVKGMYEGWSLLIQIPEVRKLVQYDSDCRKREGNVLYKIIDTADVCK